MCANNVARREDDRQLEAADDMAEQQESGEQREPAAAGDRERHACALARSGLLAPVAYQQERGQAGQLPEYEQQQHIVGQYYSEHAAHEQQQESVETAHRIARRQVIARVHDDQQAHQQDQQYEQQAQAIESQRQIQVQCGEPRPAGVQGLTRENCGNCRDHERQRAGRDHSSGPCGHCASETDTERR